MQTFAKHWVVVPYCIEQLQHGYRNSKVEEDPRPPRIALDLVCPFTRTCQWS